MTKTWPEADRLHALLGRLDALGAGERMAELALAERESTSQRFSTALGVSRYLAGGGLTFREVAKMMEEFPPLSGLTESNLEGKRRYLNRMPLERFAGMLKRFPPIAGMSAEGLEEKRRHLDNMTPWEFSAMVGKCPSIANYSIGTMEERRSYLDMPIEKFAKLVRAFPQIVELSTANLESKFSFYETKFGIDRREILDSVIESKPKANLRYSIPGRVLPRYFAYRLMLRGTGKDVDAARFRTLLSYSDERFPESLGEKPRRLAINGELERARKVYERAKELCLTLLRDGRTSAARVPLKAAA